MITPIAMSLPSDGRFLRLSGTATAGPLPGCVGGEIMTPDGVKLACPCGNPGCA